MGLPQAHSQGGRGGRRKEREGHRGGRGRILQANQAGSWQSQHARVSSCRKNPVCKTGRREADVCPGGEVMGHFLFNVTAANKALSIPSVLHPILKYFNMFQELWK